MLTIRPEGHGSFTGQPRRELLVGGDEPLGPHRHHDGPKPVQDLVGAVGARRDLRVQPDERLAQVGFHQNLVRPPRKVSRLEVVPAEPGELPAPACPARPDRRVVGDPAAQEIA